MLTDEKSGPRRLFKRRSIRAAGILLAGLAASVAALALSLPSLINQDNARQKIEEQIEAWSGLPVKVNGPVKLSFFPGIHAELSDVASQSPKEQVSFSAKTVGADIPLASLLTGSLGWSNLSIADAVILFRPRTGGQALPFSQSRIFRPAIAAASAALSANRADPDLSKIENLVIGNVSVLRSSVTIIFPSGREDHFTQVSGLMNWPRLRSTGSFTGKGLWRGETIEASLKVASPLAFAAGGASEVSLSAASPPLTVQFEGETNMSADFFAGGALILHAPSLGKALAWAHVPVSAAAGLGSLDLTAKMTSADKTVKLDDVALSLGGNPATGTLEIEPNGTASRLGGTLAFESLDLGALVGGGAVAEAADISEPALDLRLSADTAVAGPLSLTAVAGTIRTDRGGTRLDLGSAALGGGSLTAALALSGPGNAQNGELHVTGKSVSPAKISAMADGLPALDGTIDFEATLSGPYGGPAAFLSASSGTVSIRSGAATLRNFSASAFAAKVREGRIFALPEAFAGLTAIKTAAIDATVNKGLAIAESCEIVTDGERITLAGALPFDTGGVALNGTAANADGSDIVPFFVGGAWDRPFVTTMPRPN